MARCTAIDCKEEATGKLDIVHRDSAGHEMVFRDVGLCDPHRRKTEAAIKAGQAPSFEIQYPAFCQLHQEPLLRVGLAKDGVARRGYCPTCREDWVETRLNNWVPAR